MVRLFHGKFVVRKTGVTNEPIRHGINEQSNSLSDQLNIMSQINKSLQEEAEDFSSILITRLG